MPAYFASRDVFGHRSFLERAAAGDLPAVSWIDPNFYDLTFGPAGSNDDHPPSDLHAGQKLVLQLFPQHRFCRPAWLQVDGPCRLRRQYAFLWVQTRASVIRRILMSNARLQFSM